MTGSNVIVPGVDRNAQMQVEDKTITFLNSSGEVDVFTITGRVVVAMITAHVDTDVVEDGAVTSIELGTNGDPDALIVQTNPSLLLAATPWWKDATPLASAAQIDAAQIDVMIKEDIVLTITGGTDLDSGAITFRAWYLPQTDGALLVPA